jgi:hypothetical protein
MIDTNGRIAQVYGYTVCLVCVVVFLASLAGILGAAFDLSDPVHADWHGGYSGYGPMMPLSSFELYRSETRKMESMRPMSMRAPDGTIQSEVRPPISDADLRQNYDAERAERIGNVRFHAERQLVIGLVFLVLAGGLFRMHWKWLRREELPAR